MFNNNFSPQYVRSIWIRVPKKIVINSHTNQPNYKNIIFLKKKSLIFLIYANNKFKITTKKHRYEF